MSDESKQPRCVKCLKPVEEVGKSGWWHVSPHDQQSDHWAVPEHLWPKGKPLPGRHEKERTRDD